MLDIPNEAGKLAMKKSLVVELALIAGEHEPRMLYEFMLACLVRQAKPLS